MKTVIVICCILYQPLLPTANDNEAENNDNDENDTSVLGEVNPELKIQPTPGNTNALAVDPRYVVEVKAGDMADLFASNQHRYVPHLYKDFGRRAYQTIKEKGQPLEIGIDGEADLERLMREYLEAAKDVENKEEYKEVDNRLTPKRAPPELVLQVAKESALLAAAKPVDPTAEVIKKAILRTGDYWDRVWMEPVADPEGALRSRSNNTSAKPAGDYTNLNVVTVKIMPGSKLYHTVSVAKRISPRLLYIMNK